MTNQIHSNPFLFYEHYRRLVHQILPFVFSEVFRGGWTERVLTGFLVGGDWGGLMVGQEVPVWSPQIDATRVLACVSACMRVSVSVCERACMRVSVRAAYVHV